LNSEGERAGFALHRAMFAVDELAALAAEAPRLPRSRAGARHVLDVPAVSALACDARMLAAAGQWLDGHAIPFRATLFDKSPEANWLVAWHQDTALPLETRVDAPGWGPWSEKQGVWYAHAPASALEKVVALRLHLDDSTGDNGPLRVLPGTHRLGVLGDAEVSRIARESAAVDCLARAGDVLAMRPLIIHASSKVARETPRRVLHIEYAASLELGQRLKLRPA
jgi:hypothetical protein